VARIADGLGLNSRFTADQAQDQQAMHKVVGPESTGPAISPRTEKIKADT